MYSLPILNNISKNNLKERNQVLLINMMLQLAGFELEVLLGWKIANQSINRLFSQPENANKS